MRGWSLLPAAWPLQDVAEAFSFSPLGLGCNSTAVMAVAGGGFVRLVELQARDASLWLCSPAVDASAVVGSQCSVHWSPRLLLGDVPVSLLAVGGTAGVGVWLVRAQQRLTSSPAAVLRSARKSPRVTALRWLDAVAHTDVRADSDTVRRALLLATGTDSGAVVVWRVDVLRDGELSTSELAVVGPSDGRRVVSVRWSGVAAGTPALAMAAGPRLAVWTPDAAAWGRLVHGDAALEDDAAADVPVVENLNTHAGNITDVAWAVGGSGSCGYVLSSTLCSQCASLLHV
jgi:hypothetical protein